MDAGFLEALAGFVPLAQTLIWILFAAGVLYYFRGPVGDLAAAVRERVSSGAEVETPWLTLRGAPREVRGLQPGVATSEGAGGTETAETVRTRLVGKDYPAGLSEELYLIHAAETVRPRRADKPGLWRVRLWLEAYDSGTFGAVDRVSYRLYEDEFPQPVISTEDAAKDFELWLSVYGEFTVVAYVERRSAEPVWLTRYLDLPGRPPD